MTTEQPPRPRRHGAASPQWGALLVGPLVAGGGLGALLVAAGAGLSGPAAARGAAIGAVMVCLVFTFGAVVLGVIARIAPAASLLVALLTYTLQVVVVGLVYLALAGSGTLGETVDARWLSGAVIAATLGWTLAQVVVSMRARQPVYDLPSAQSEASVR
jgi:ATP synthase protein I